MEKETIQVFEKEQQTSENKVDDLEKEITQGKLEERGQSENDSETVPEEPSPSSPEEENAPSQKDLLEKMMLMDQKTPDVRSFPCHRKKNRHLKKKQPLCGKNIFRERRL